ncbi:MAG: MerR family DNA-binding protein [Stellaceae bacterium]
MLELTRRGQQPCARVQQLARRHLQSVDAKIRELKSVRRELRALVGRDATIPVKPNQICPLIGAQLD